MLGAAGILGEDLLGKLGIAGPAAKVPWFEAGDYEYFAPSSTLFITELFLFGWWGPLLYHKCSSNQGSAGLSCTDKLRLPLQNYVVPVVRRPGSKRREQGRVNEMITKRGGLTSQVFSWTPRPRPKVQAEQRLACSTTCSPSGEGFSLMLWG